MHTRSFQKTPLTAISQAGFTLLELMITVAIVGILASIAIPSYQDYTRRASYSEVVIQTSPYKLGVTSCYNLIGTFMGCDAGTNDIPAEIKGGTGLVNSLAVKDGKITITPNTMKGITPEDTYILEPRVPEGSYAILWKSAGGGVEKGYAK